MSPADAPTVSGLETRISSAVMASSPATNWLLREMPQEETTTITAMAAMVFFNRSVGRWLIVVNHSPDHQDQISNQGRVRLEPRPVPLLSLRLCPGQTRPASTLIHADKGLVPG